MNEKGSTVKSAPLDDSSKQTWIEKLKQRWGVSSGYQFVVILLVFSVTGSSTAWLVPNLFSLFGVNLQSGLGVKVALIFSGFVTYQLLLICFGFLAGQLRFFWQFEKKSLGRIGKLIRLLFRQ
ncbi:DUF6787 family protein [Reinekea thalattae]|uniref:DUF6787 family protein n=1 Tax=Reinekea thalattae TaxID=2593301 RepID=UPI001C9C6FE4|nr:DUF6787 family protein [Reinekea thalattae]